MGFGGRPPLQMMLFSAVLLVLVPLAASLRVAPPVFGWAAVARVSRAAPPLASAADDAERKARLEALGREVAAEAKYLDSAPADDDLSAAFNARLAAEGGRSAFRLKTDAAAATEGATAAARKAKDALLDAKDGLSGMTNGLTKQQQNIAKIVLGLIAFQVVIGIISSSF